MKEAKRIAAPMIGVKRAQNAQPQNTKIYVCFRIIIFFFLYFIFILMIINLLNIHQDNRNKQTNRKKNEP